MSQENTPNELPTDNNKAVSDPKPEPEVKVEEEDEEESTNIMPPNEEDAPRITSRKKEKDPRRVEAGKKLALISKMAKEKKAMERKRRLEEEKRMRAHIEAKKQQEIGEPPQVCIFKSEEMDHTML